MEQPSYVNAAENNFYSTLVIMGKDGLPVLETWSDHHGCCNAGVSRVVS